MLATVGVPPMNRDGAAIAEDRPRGVAADGERVVGVVAEEAENAGAGDERAVTAVMEKSSVALAARAFWSADGTIETIDVEDKAVVFPNSLRMAMVMPFA